MGSTFFEVPTGASELWTPERATSEQRLAYESVRQFAEVTLPPYEAALEGHDYQVARDLFRQCAALGVFAAELDEIDGGLGLGLVDTTLLSEALGRAHSLNVGLMVHLGVGMLPIACFGTPEQRETYLPGAAAGETIMAFALTEPHCGSDALALTTTAIPDGDSFVINGAKQFITNAAYADCFITFARVPEIGITAFLVDAGIPGLSVGPEEKKLGQHASSTCSVFYDGVRVPAKNRLGGAGEGHLIALNMLNIGRLKLAAACVGKMKVLLPQAISYVTGRRAFDQSISAFGMIRDRIARMVSNAFVAEAMVYRVASIMEEALADARGSRGHLPGSERLRVLEQFALECALVKSFTTEALGTFTDDMLQLYGGYGFSEEYPAAKAFRDARVTRLYEGTTEICRLTVARRLYAQAGALPMAEKSERNNPWLATLAKTMIARYLRVYVGEDPKAIARPGQEVTGELVAALEQAYAVESGWLRCSAMGGASPMAHDVVSYFESCVSPQVYGPLSVIHGELSDEVYGRLDGFWAASPFGARSASRDKIVQAIIDSGGKLPGSL